MLAATNGPDSILIEFGSVYLLCLWLLHLLILFVLCLERSFQLALLNLPLIYMECLPAVMVITAFEMCFVVLSVPYQMYFISFM